MVLLLQIPWGFPAFTIYYFGFIAGNGVLLAILYRFSSLGFGQGRAIVSLRSTKGWIPGALIAVGVATFFLVLTRTGIFYIYPLNIRVFWLLLFTPLTAIGFFIGGREIELLPLDGLGRALLTLIQYLPFILLAVLYIAIRSVSGFIGIAYGLAALSIIVRAGNWMRSLGGNSVLIAMAQGFLLQLVILPQGVLFG